MLHSILYALLPLLSITTFTAEAIPLDFVTIPLDGAYGQKYTVSCNNYAYFRVNMTYACKDLNVTVNPLGGQPDVYVSRDFSGKFSYPQKSDLTWSAFTDGHFNVFISHWDTDSSPGNYDISVYNDCSRQSQDAVFQIKAVTSFNDDEDLYIHQERARNVFLPPLGYVFYKFCVPECANTYSTIYSHVDKTIYPGNYSYPVLSISRTIQMPRVNDYSYKLYSSGRSIITDVSADPAGVRDKNGFVSGPYYVGVFGYCIPSHEYLSDDGYCGYAEHIFFNLTIEIISRANDTACTAPIKLPDISNYPILVPNQLLKGYVDCNSNTTYRLKVPYPCQDINFYLKTYKIDPHYVNDTAELAIGKYPNLSPNFATMCWSSFDNGIQNFTISAYDPSFDGGHNCGPNQTDLCELYVGIVPYCTHNSASFVLFDLQVTMTETTGIYEAPLQNQKIQPQGVNNYGFCVSQNVSTDAVLDVNRDACNCPNNYTNMQMAISKTNREASLNDYVWRLDDATSAHTIPLKVTSNGVYPGTYYLNVFGECETNSQCTDKCTCAPCSNLAKTSYSIYVGQTLSPTTISSLGQCPSSGSSSTCSSQCPSSSSSGNNGLSAGAIAGIVISFLVILVVIFLGMCCYRRSKESKSPRHNQSHDETHNQEFSNLASENY